MSQFELWRKHEARTFKEWGVGSSAHLLWSRKWVEGVGGDAVFPVWVQWKTLSISRPVGTSEVLTDSTCWSCAAFSCTVLLRCTGKCHPICQYLTCTANWCSYAVPPCISSYEEGRVGKVRLEPNTARSRSGVFGSMWIHVRYQYMLVATVSQGTRFATSTR